MITLISCQGFSDNAKQKSELLEWVATKTGGLRAPRNFTSDWSCGITLCALLEAIVPGSCPRYDLLNPENAIQNIQQGLAIANEVLDIETVSSIPFVIWNVMFHNILLEPRCRKVIRRKCRERTHFPFDALEARGCQTKTAFCN